MDFLLLSPIKSLITSLLFLILLVIITHIPALNVVEASYDIKSLNLKEVAFAFLLCGISFWGLFFFNLSLKHTVSGVTITVTGAGTVISFLIAIFVFNEKFSGYNLLSSIIGLFGLWCLEKLNPAFFKLKLSKGMLFALLSMLFWRMSSLYPLSINKVGVLQFSFILELTVCLISLGIFLISKSNYNECLVKAKSYRKIIAAIAITNFLGVLGGNMALKFTSLISFTIFGIIAPVITFTISLVFYKERYTLIQYVGILVLIFGGIVVNYFK